MAGPVSRVQRLELDGRGTSRAGGGDGRIDREALCACRGRRASALCRHRHGRRRAVVDRHRRVRSRARRRCRTRLARAHRRRARDWQVNAVAAGRGALRAHHRTGAVLLGRRIRAPDQVTRRAPWRRARAALHPRRDLPRTDSRRGRPPPAGARDRGLHSNGVLAQVPVGAREYRSGTRVGDRNCSLPPRVRTSRRFSSDMSPRTATSPARRLSSTSSTRCCTSRAKSTMRIVSSGR